MVVADFQTSCALRGGKKQSTRNAKIRKPKIYRCKDKHTYTRTLICMLEQQRDTAKSWDQIIPETALKFMGKGKARNSEIEEAVKAIGHMHKRRAILDKLRAGIKAAKHYIQSNKPYMQPKITRLLRRKWKMLTHTTLPITHKNWTAMSELENLEATLNTEVWGSRDWYSSEIHKIRETLHQHQQQTINVTRAGHEYENFVMGQKKRKHQIVKMTRPKWSFAKR